MSRIKKIVKLVLPYWIIRRYEKRHELKPENAPLNDKKIAVISAYDVKYVDLLQEAVERAGYKFSNRASDAKYVWLHWYENGVADYDKFLYKISVIGLWRRQGRKVIFHIHNKKPHESKVPSVSHALMTVLADSSDHVSIMSTATKDALKDIWYYGNDFSQVSKVPHPNYIGAYGSISKPVSLNKKTLKILFFGLVRPYKGVEHLLDATKGLENLEISIVGKPLNPEYAREIRALCAGRKDVTLRLEHIKDKEVPKIFAEHHIVALPYNIDSSLNSGAAILALSYARTVVGTNNGTLSDIKNSSLYFGYDYSSESDHAIQLRKVIKTIQAKYRNDYNKLLDVGDKALRHVEKENSIEAIAGSIKDMIRRIG